jgi:hypothetical protein
MCGVTGAFPPIFVVSNESITKLNVALFISEFKNNCHFFVEYLKINTSEALTDGYVD